MNEQIAKLANECGFDIDKTGTFGNYSEMHRLEKFAELIVRECMLVIEDAVDHREPASTYVAKLADHFGVTE